MNRTPVESGLVEIVTTLAHGKDAARIARVIVEERLAACGTSGAVRSTYSWMGEIVEEPEVLLTFKTTAACAGRTEQRLRELHPYETPMILRLAILRANPEYAQWVRSAVLDAESE